jgi:hypothetical protein
VGSTTIYGDISTVVHETTVPQPVAEAENNCEIENILQSQNKLFKLLF